MRWSGAASAICSNPKATSKLWMRRPPRPKRWSGYPRRTLMSPFLGLSGYALSWAQRRRGGRGLTSSVAGAASLGLGGWLGGWLGGHLAYAQGVGVDTTAFQAGPTDWTDACAAGSVTDVLVQIEVGGVPLLVTGVGGAPVALANRCTHRGGPLSDGERDGDCVVCPWHGSRVSLVTGKVREGPATRPQPAYEVRERAGRIEVRRVEHRALRVNPVGR